MPFTKLPDPIFFWFSTGLPTTGVATSCSPTTSRCYSFRLCGAQPKENVWHEIRENIFKNYALKSIDAVRAKLEQAILYLEHNPDIVKSITGFPYIIKSL